MQLKLSFSHSVKTFNGEHLNRIQVDAAKTIKKIYFFVSALIMFTRQILLDLYAIEY